MNTRSSLTLVFLSSILVVASFCHVLPSRFSMTAAASKPPQPLWEIDLAKYGYQGRPPIQLRNEDNWGFGTYKQGVVFLESKVLATFFVVHDEPPGATAASRKPLPSDTYRVVAVFLNADRGELIKQLEWTLPSATQSIPSFSFFPATKGGFVVGIGNTLSLYSPDFKVLAQHPVEEDFSAAASPSGETVLIRYIPTGQGIWTERFDLLETDGLSVLKTWDSLPQHYQILWGDEIATMTSKGISLRTRDTAAKVVVAGDEWFCGDWGFINREMIATVRCGEKQKLFVISTDGKILHQFDLGLEQSDGPVIASRNGERYAVPTMHWGSGRNKDPENLFARVFGLATDKPLLTLDVTPHYGSGPNFLTPEGDTRFGWGGLALSPDGELLAVKSGGIVELYQVPESGKPSACSGDCARDGGGANSRPALSRQNLEISWASATGAPAQLVEQALSWLPADTETVMAANGPFVLPNLNQEAEEAGVNEPDEISGTFQMFPLGLFSFDKGILGKYFKGEKVLLALEGSRNFGAPSGLGEGPFQGCGVAVFTEDIAARADSFLKDSASVVLRTERMEGHDVAVFQEKMEDDTWTTFVAFPKPNVAVAATNEDYLRGVLARMDRKADERALPDSLPEWKYVNRRAAFWAVRHYNENGASTDPTSPFARTHAGLIKDDQAIGLAFTFDPARSPTATITYLSADKNVLTNVREHFMPIAHEQGATEMHIRYREIAPGAVEGSFDLQHIESAETFAFVLGPLFGHMVAV
jgi:hypothetical protein